MTDAQHYAQAYEPAVRGPFRVQGSSACAGRAARIMKAHDLPRPYRLAIPIEVVPKIDALKAQGHKQRAIAKALGVHWRTISAVLKRQGGYIDVPRP